MKKLINRMLAELVTSDSDLHARFIDETQVRTVPPFNAGYRNMVVS